MGPSSNVRISIYYSYIHVELGNLGGVILTGTMYRNYYLSHEYSYKTLFIPVLFPDIIINTKNIIKYIFIIIIFLLFKPTLFVIYTSVDSFLFSKILPIKVR